MENKQTAVNWMANELLHLDNEFDMKLIDKNEYQARRKEVIEQAKEMEKQQIIDAASDHCYPTRESARFNAEEYYEETFKSE